MGFISHPSGIPGGEGRDANDQRRLRHARQTDTGFPVGRYLQPPPMLFTRDGHNAFLGDMYRGHTAFLVCSGPSLKTHDLTKLQGRGFVTMSVNNAATVVPTRLWACVDDPGNFSDVIWRDPAITKFVPLCHMEKHFHERDAENYLVPSTEHVGDMPAVFGFRRNENFVASQWLYEDTINWGNRGDRVDEHGHKGSRSVMYVALRLLFFLGIRRVYLVGCDFRMEVGAQNYAFPQDRTVSSVRGNNSSYRVLNARLEHLKPYFAHEGFEVYNCTPNSGLQVFPHVPYELAMEQAQQHLPSQVVTEGMYDRKHVRPAPTAPNAAAADAKQPAKVIVPPDKAPRVSCPAMVPITAAPSPLSASSPSKSVPAGPQNKPSRPKEELSITVVTTVDESLSSYWTTTSASWDRYKSSLSAATWLIGFDPDWREARGQLDDGLGNPRRRLIPWPQSRYRSQREKLAASWPAIAASEVKTPWVLYLAAHTLAEGDGPCYEPRWLMANPDDQAPVLITSPYDLSTAEEERVFWNRWGDAVPELSPFPAIDSLWSHDSHSGSARRQAPWYCLVRTDWLRTQWELLNRHPPQQFHDWFLHHCAARRRDYVVSADPTVCRWRSVAGRPRLLRRQRSLLLAR